MAVLSGEHLHVYHDAVFAVRHSQGGISHLSGLFTEDGAQQPLLRGQLRLALRGDLAYQDIAGADLGADMDNAALIQILAAASSLTLGMSRVISSGPSLVSRASISYSSI